MVFSKYFSVNKSPLRTPFLSVGFLRVLCEGWKGSLSVVVVSVNVACRCVVQRGINRFFALASGNARISKKNAFFPFPKGRRRLILVLQRRYRRVVCLFTLGANTSGSHHFTSHYSSGTVCRASSLHTCNNEVLVPCFLYYSVAGGCLLVSVWFFFFFLPPQALLMAERMFESTR